jgi:hypothetical protein
MFKVLCVLLLTTMIAQYGQPAAEVASAAERLEWLKDDAKSASSQGESATDRNRGENVMSKGILERSFRLRSRLNTHLLMLKFRR